VIEEVRGTDVGGEGLRVVRFRIAGQGEDALDVAVDMEAPGKARGVAGENAGSSGGDEIAERRGDGARLPGQRELGAIVEVAVAVVVKAGGDVEGGVAVTVVVGAEDDLAGDVDVQVAEVLPEGVAGLDRVLAGVGRGALRRKEGIVVSVRKNVDANGADEELDGLKLLVADAGELDVPRDIR